MCIYIHFNNRVRTSQVTSYIPIIETKHLTLFRQIIGVYFDNHTQQMETVHDATVKVAKTLSTVRASGIYSNQCI
jgi:hypothetical protein